MVGSAGVGCVACKADPASGVPRKGVFCKVEESPLCIPTASASGVLQPVCCCAMLGVSYPVRFLIDHG
jgi:hypothetical protein